MENETDFESLKASSRSNLAAKLTEDNILH